jgi:hypothetical protein
MTLRIPCVAYLRRSDKGQEPSIERQRFEVTRYAKDHGYEILRWYIDDGISGDDTENRKEFLRMCQDVGDFVAVLCDNRDRFGQLDAGHWAYRFCRSGVYLVACDAGRINWVSEQGYPVVGATDADRVFICPECGSRTAYHPEEWAHLNIYRYPAGKVEVFSVRLVWCPRCWKPCEVPDPPGAKR